MLTPTNPYAILTPGSIDHESGTTRSTNWREERTKRAPEQVTELP
jgi:hypothetical protein